MINQVVLIGNVGQEPEQTTLTNGTIVCKFSIATNENYQDKAGNWQQNTEWHNVIAWNNLCKAISNHVKKGMLLFIEGKIKYRKWNDQEGKPHQATEIVANSFRILEKRQTENLRNVYQEEISADWK